MKHVLICATILLPGCFWTTTKHEGDLLRTDIADLKGRVSKQEATVDAKVAKLDESLAKATTVLQRNSADVGADVEKMSAELATLSGLINDLRRENDQLKLELAKERAEGSEKVLALTARLDALDKGGVKPVVPATGTLDKDPLWDGAVKKLAGTDVEGGRKDLRQYVSRFPQDMRADDAEFKIGESYQKEKAYEKAIESYQRVIDNYPMGDMVDDAFYAAGLAALEMKWCIDARAYFGELVRRYPQSPHIKNAKLKLDFIVKNAQNKKVCPS
jgi:TolA-binding protein